VDDDGDAGGDSRRTLAFAVGFAVTAALLALVLALGGWAYDYRLYSLHDSRLRRLVVQHPPVEQARQGLLAESGTEELIAPSSESELRALVPNLSLAQAAALVSKRRQWSAVRAFRVGEMLYFLYVDERGLVQDYSLQRK
jgi:hypothetical protein